MIVRLAEKSELQESFNLFKAFESCSSLVTVVPSVCVENYSRFIDQGIGGLLLARDSYRTYGGLGFIIANDIHNGKKYAVETFWLMLPEHRGGGIKLLEAFEKLATDAGCDECAMIHLEDSFPASLEKLYIRRGYQLAEKHFIKRLKP